MESSGSSSDPAMLAGMEGLIAAMKDRRPATGGDDEPASDVLETRALPSQESDDMLAAAPWHAVGASLLDPSDGVASRERASALLPGAVVDRYVVLKELGAGGMGAVYAAYDPELDRKVALKLLLPGAGDEQGGARLLREAHALGKLAHPNIVAVHDAGTVGEQVWLAMELVQGRTLGAWLKQHHGWREVVRVMRSAGKGLAAAHAAGLLHRDFKPENVMIGDDARVRVMDFGLARVGPEGVPSEDDGAQQPAVETLAMQITAAGAIVGTPSYMAPEQFEGQELTAAADQFAFCVTLWEALYGERPFGGRTIMEIVANVLGGRRRPPPKDRAVPSRLRRACERGLSIEPRQRWPSMEALLDELRRLAAPFGRRWLALGVTGGLVALGGGLALARYVEVMDRCMGASAQLDGIWDEAKRQEVERAILGTGLSYASGTWERVEQRLDGYADAWASKHTEVCEATRVTEEQTEAVMDLRMGCLRGRRTALGAAVEVLASADAEVVEKAVELVAGLPRLDRCDDVDFLERQRQRVPPPEDPQVAQEVEALRERLAEIEAEESAGKYAHALERLEPVVQRAEALGYVPLLAEARLRRGDLLDEVGNYAEAEQDLQSAYALALRSEHDEVALESARVLTYVVGDGQARYAEGLVWGQMALPLAERRGEGIEAAASLTSLGNVLERQGKYEEAKLRHQRALQIREQVLSADHPDLAMSSSDLGNVLDDLGEYEQAELHHRRALLIYEAALGVGHPLVAATSNNLGNAFLGQGKYEQAKLHYQRALHTWEEALGVDHPNVAASLTGLGNALYRQGEHEQAKLHHQRALRIRQKALGAEHPDVAMSLNTLGAVFEGQGDYEQAELHYQQALRTWEEALGADHPHLAMSLNNLGNVLQNQGDYEQAALHYRRALRIQEEALGADHSDVAVSSNNLGAVFQRLEEHEQAELHYRRALQIFEKVLSADHPHLAYPLMGLAEVALARDRFAVARAHAARAVSIRESTEAPAELLAKSRFVLARALWSDEAERARARALAEQARDVLAEHGKGQEEDLAAIEAWLAEHRPR